MASADVSQQVYVVSDDRERDVIPFARDLFLPHEIVTQRITVGDYLVLRSQAGCEPEVLAVIERKTLKDFAQSFCDGRHENLAKLLELRAKTRCQIIFIVEGTPAFPAPTTRFCHVPFACIQGAITKMQVRHLIMFERTQDQEHTARRLVALRAAYASETPHVVALSASEDDTTTSGGDVLPSAAKDAAVVDSTMVDKDEAANDKEVSTDRVLVPAAALVRVEPSIAEMAAHAWAGLKGVSLVLGHRLAHYFSIADLVASRVAPETVVALRTAGGRQLPREARRSLAALAAGEPEAETRVLSGVRGVGPATAAAALKSGGGLRGILASTPADIANLTYPTASRQTKIGLIRATKIFEVLSYKQA